MQAVIRGGNKFITVVFVKLILNCRFRYSLIINYCNQKFAILLDHAQICSNSIIRKLIT